MSGILHLCDYRVLYINVNTTEHYLANYMQI